MIWADNVQRKYSVSWVDNSDFVTELASGNRIEKVKLQQDEDATILVGGTYMYTVYSIHIQ